VSLQHFDSLRLLKVTPLTLVTYLTLLERHYRPHNSYHNSIHAADVVQSAFVLLGHSALQVTATAAHWHAITTSTTPRDHRVVMVHIIFVATMQQQLRGLPISLYNPLKRSGV